MALVEDIDRGLLNIKKVLKELKKTTLSVGVFSDSVNTKEKNVTYVADYAITNEYGSKHMNIPARSFIGSTADEQQKKWAKSLDKVWDKGVQGAQNIDRELYKIGALARRDIIAKINSNIYPPNSDATKKRKGKKKNKTLIDDGFLIKSIEARIIKG